MKSSLDGHNLDKPNGLPTNYRNDSNGEKLSRLITGAEGKRAYEGTWSMVCNDPRIRPVHTGISGDWHG